MNEDSKSKSLAEKLQRFDIARHGGEAMADAAPVGGEAFATDAAYSALLHKAQQLVAESTSTAALRFDTERWLRGWIQIPQPALGGHRPVEMLATRAGVESVLRVLGAFLSGAVL